MVGMGSLTAATFLWGSSFPVIKVLVVELDELTYTWFRGLLATVVLLPYIVYRAGRGSIERDTIVGGLRTGVAYTFGLWLQGWGTRYTTASNSAFITALHMVFVHIHVATARRSYSSSLALAVVLSILGVYLLTVPSTGFNIGDLLVLLGALGWASQVILVDKYSRGDPLQFVFGQFAVSLLFVIPDYIDEGVILPSKKQLGLLAYLATVTGIGAFSLQVLGQRFVGPAASAVTFQMEPVFASLLSVTLLNEILVSKQVVGAALVLAATALSGREDVKTVEATVLRRLGMKSR